MSKLSHHTLKDLERDRFLAQDTVGLFDVCRGLLRRQMHCALDAVETEPNHVLFGLKLPIPFQQFACQDWFFAILMFCDRWGGKTASIPWIAARLMVGICIPSLNWVAA